MKPSKKKLKSIIVLFLGLFFTGTILAQEFDPNATYRLTNQFLSEGRSLDVINDAAKDKVKLVKTGNFTGQFWKITSVGNGYYRLTNQFTGEGKSLDVINDAAKDKVQMAKTGNFTGQYWKITSVGNGYYRLTNQYTGEGKSLDVINDAAKDKVNLAKTGNFTGQFWKITNLSPTNNSAVAQPATRVPQSPSTSTPTAATQSLIPAGSELKKDFKYTSPSGNHYLILQSDGNMIIKTKADGYVWGLDQLRKNSAARVEFSRDGQLIAYDKQGKLLWSPQTKKDPAAKLAMNFNGALQIVAGNNEILWSSDGILSPMTNVFQMKANLKKGTPETGWAQCYEMTGPNIKIMATKAVTYSAINGVANIIYEMTNRFGPKYPKEKFDDFIIYLTNGEKWSELRSLKSIAVRPEKPYNTSDDFYRGYGGEHALWITEQMICKTGVKTRNETGIIKDNDSRTVDQVVHEFSHSIDFKYIPDATINLFSGNGTPVESFPLQIQRWFGAPAGSIPANQENVLKQLFTSRTIFSCEGYRP